MRATTTLLRATFIAATSALIFSASAEEVDVPIPEKARIYKSEQAQASTESDSTGAVLLHYDFTNGGDTARFEFLCVTPIDGPVSSFKVTAAGPNDITPIFGIRDVNSAAVGYRLGPLTEQSQEYHIDLATPAMAGAAAKLKIEYPLKGFMVTVQNKGIAEKGTITLSKITAVTAP